MKKLKISLKILNEKKRILVQTKNVSFNKVKKLLYDLENNFFLEFFITDDTYIISKNTKKP